MATIKTFVKRHPVATYYAITFAISWGGMLLVIGGPGGIPGTPEQFARLMPLAVPVMLVGPTVAGLLVTGLTSGRAGFRALRARWRVGARWYALALLTTPLLATAILATLSLISANYLPAIVVTDDRVSLLLLGSAVGLVGGGVLEELGWTGCAIPQLRERRSVLATGLIVGALWGVWHFLVNFWSSGNSSGALSLDLLLPSLLFSVGILPAYRVLMAWAFDRTKSLPVAMLMHASLTACTLFILMPQATGPALVAYYLVMTGALWGLVGAVGVADGRHLARRTLRMQTA
jgi:uncharacterized protein